MDTRSLIALGMLLGLVLAALVKNAVQPNDVKEIVLFLGGGIIGFTVPRRPDASQPKPNQPPTVPPAILMLLAGSLVLLVSCATVPRCSPVMAQCNPADYPPITKALPEGPPAMTPFPRLLQPLPEGGSK